ncbi:hypothetical protein F5880DRAFT_1510473 [Lentinula raphanica]|nr:hypothetical protein F5880DRAFT_1510473 [Lentinula raphanica]
MESPISLADISQSPPSETLDLPSNVDDSTPSAPNTNPSHTLGGEWGDTSSDAWGSGWGEQNTGWGHSYTSNWGTEYLTRSSVLQTMTETRRWIIYITRHGLAYSTSVYRSSEQGRKDHAPFPTFTLPQVEQRFQQVQASIRIRLREKEVLANEIEAMAQNLADKKKKAKEIEDELVSLKFSVEELRDLHLIAHARLP